MESEAKRVGTESTVPGAGGYLTSTEDTYPGRRTVRVVRTALDESRRKENRGSRHSGPQSHVD